MPVPSTSVPQSTRLTGATAWFAAVLLAGCAPDNAAAPRMARPSAQLTAARVQAAVSQQSPIDIEGSDLQIVKKRDVAPLTFQYATNATVDLENTGSPGEESTVRANVTPGDAVLHVGDTDYRLVQFHWHIPAEHEVDGVRYPMEMHLVHNGADGSTLVVGVFLRAGAANAILAPMFSQLPPQSGGHASVSGINIAALIPRHDESARYTGSLTTPPFTEGVHWIVLVPPIELSHSEIAEFGALFPEGNAREVQPLNGRTVFTDDHNFEHDAGLQGKLIH
jgi:carbonic anhydrase